MIEVIYETIYQHNRKPGITMYEMASLILAAQERAGILPPHRAVGPFEANFTWEPEDEKK